MANQRQQKALRDEMRRVANERMPPALLLPERFRLLPGPIVQCAVCLREWKVPAGMKTRLTSAARKLLEQHALKHGLWVEHDHLVTAFDHRAWPPLTRRPAEYGAYHNHNG